MGLVLLKAQIFSSVVKKVCINAKKKTGQNKKYMRG